MYLPTLFASLSLACTYAQDIPYGLATGVSVQVLDGPDTLASLADLELEKSRRALSLIRDRLGPKELLKLLEPEIGASDRFWLSLANSSSSTQDLVPVFVHLTAAFDLPIMDAPLFLSWLGAAGPPGANPEEYVGSRVATSKNTTGSEAVQSLGGHVTRFAIRRAEKKPYMAHLPPFPIQRAVQFVLATGEAFADFHLALRDGQTSRDGRDGIEAALYLWLPAGTPSAAAESAAADVAVTFANYLRAAYQDVAYGRFQPGCSPHSKRAAPDTAPVRMVSPAV